MEICNSDYMAIYEIIRIILIILKIVLPLIIIGLGTFDFYKAVVASKEDEIKTATKRFIFRIISGILIFLLPSIVSMVFKVTNLVDTDKSCIYQCILDSECTPVNYNNSNNEENNNNQNNNNENNNEVNNNEECTVENESCISNAIFLE